MSCDAFSEQHIRLSSNVQRPANPMHSDQSSIGNPSASVGSVTSASAQGVSRGQVRLLNATQRAAVRVLMNDKDLSPLDIMRKTGWSMSDKPFRRAASNAYSPPDDLHADPGLLASDTAAAELGIPMPFKALLEQIDAEAAVLAAAEEAATPRPLSSTSNKGFKARQQPNSTTVDTELPSHFGAVGPLVPVPQPGPSGELQLHPALVPVDAVPVAPTAFPIDPIYAFITSASLGIHWIPCLRAAGFTDAASLQAMSKFHKIHVEHFVAQTFPNANDLEKFFLLRAFNPQE
ncbi:hypothetical protein C8R43DRAFT_1132313 [Mycena crocata]|nr:hypothetical protein C8R43DRAFT_1132313 [Mycena crocata]